MPDIVSSKRLYILWPSITGTGDGATWKSAIIPLPSRRMGRRAFRGVAMTDEQGNSVSLTGVWHGLYAGGGARGHVSFVATLLETASFVSGATHEPRAVGGMPG